jgi:hypothetical protein
MQRQVLTPEEVKLILQNADLIDRARIAEGGWDRPPLVQILPLDLATARLETDPYRLGFPFKSIFVQDATDVYVEISVKLGSRDAQQSSFTMKQNDSFYNSFPITEAYLHWEAQPGKTAVLVIFTQSEFKSGSQISVTGGGVSIVEGSSVTGPTQAVLAAATAGIIAPADPLRKKATLQNKTGADLYLGGSTVTNAGATEGIKIPSDAIFYWLNTGALYGYSVAGGNVHRLEEA